VKQSLEKVACPICTGIRVLEFSEPADNLVSRETFKVVKCESCRLLLTNPRPSETDIAEYYRSGDYISHSDTSKGIINRLYRLARSYSIKKKVALMRSICPGATTLLDFGCGTGYFLARARERGFDVFGLEPDEGARLLAESKHGLKVSSLDELGNLPQNKFDVITLWHVLEHVYELNETMNSLVRVLSDGGKMVIAVPNAASWDCRHYGKNWAAWDVPRHLYHFTPGTLKSLLDKHGLVIQRALRMPLDVFYIALLSEKNSRNAWWLPAAFAVGAAGFLLSLFKKENASSLIYVIAKPGK
jgi:SAM-dependent methyltransferase